MWQPDGRKREMDRLYRHFLLMTLSVVCVVLIVSYFYPREQQHEPIKSGILFLISAGYGLSIAFWFRSKVKKSDIPGSEMLSYWSTKPLSRIAQLIIIILIIVHSHPIGFERKGWSFLFAPATRQG
jgi:peptidoglycan biosynthesis protein MviN/MurJ (putative lipid II flippase)